MRSLAYTYYVAGRRMSRSVSCFSELIRQDISEYVDNKSQPLPNLNKSAQIPQQYKSQLSQLTCSPPPVLRKGQGLQANSKSDPCLPTANDDIDDKDCSQAVDNIRHVPRPPSQGRRICCNSALRRHRYAPAAVMVQNP